MSARTRRARHGALVVAGVTVAVLATGCALSMTASRPGELVPGGELCYRIVENAAAGAAGLPWGVALSGDPAPLPDPGQQRAAASLAATGARSSRPFASWRVLEADSIQVGPLLTGRVQLRLAVEDGGATLRGSARPIGDVVVPGGRARPPVEGVVAQRVSCPAAP